MEQEVAMALTGRFTFRRSIGGRIILQVEEEYRSMWSLSRNRPLKKRWRDANLMDLAAPELRALIDLRYKPQFMAQYEYLAPDPAPSRPLMEGMEDRDLEGTPLPRAQLLRPASTRLRAVEDGEAETSVEVDRTATRLGRAR
jgi:hypothetical protein